MWRLQKKVECNREFQSISEEDGCLNDNSQVETTTIENHLTTLTSEATTEKAEEEATAKEGKEEKERPERRKIQAKEKRRKRK